jgi:hypothetical protein
MWTSARRGQATALRLVCFECDCVFVWDILRLCRYRIRRLSRAIEYVEILMDEPNQRCSKCGAELAQIQGGLMSCPACGLAADQKKPGSFATGTTSRVIFWLSLVSPAALALASFFASRAPLSSTGAGFLIVMAAFGVGAYASIYCGIWLAFRFCKETYTRVLMGLFSIVAIGALNFIIVFAGCVANFNALQRH